MYIKLCSPKNIGCNAESLYAINYYKNIYKIIEVSTNKIGFLLLKFAVKKSNWLNWINL